MSSYSSFFTYYSSFFILHSSFILFLCIHCLTSSDGHHLVYVIDRGEIGIVNRRRWGYVYRLTVEEARAGAAEMDNRFAREEVKEIADLAEWKKERKREEGSEDGTKNF